MLPPVKGRTNGVHTLDACAQDELHMRGDVRCRNNHSSKLGAMFGDNTSRRQCRRPQQSQLSQGVQSTMTAAYITNLLVLLNKPASSSGYCICFPFFCICPASQLIARCTAGIVFTSLCEPYLISEYGTDYLGDSPVKLLDQLLHGRKEQPEQQVCS